MSIRYSPRPEHKMTPEYTAYINAKRRCSCNPEDKDYLATTNREMFVGLHQVNRTKIRG